MRKGFTLVELAIVLVIIGLIVGGVLAGQELINQGRLRKVVTTITAYDTAAETFRNKYNGLPGDVKNPASYGFSCTASRDGSYAASNGDNILENHYSWIYLDYTALSTETLWFWDDLAVAGLISTSVDTTLSNALCGYSGSTSPSTTPPITAYLPAIDTPTGKSQVMVFPARDGSKHYFGIAPFITTGHIYGVADWDALSFTPLDAYSIDAKEDDGLPSTGKVQVGIGAIPLTPGTYPCATATPAYNTASATYKDRPQCALKFVASF